MGININNCRYNNRFVIALPKPMTPASASTVAQTHLQSSASTASVSCLSASSSSVSVVGKSKWGCREIFEKIFQILRQFFPSSVKALPAPKVYPIINSSVSHDDLKKVYRALGEHKWKEAVDRRYAHIEDKYIFDKGLHGGTVEPGYIESMEKAFDFAENSLNRRIDADWYLELHKQTASHFKGEENGTLMGQEKVGVFRDSDDFICASFSNHYIILPKAFEEFYQLDAEIRNRFGKEYGLGKFTLTNETPVTHKLSYHAMNREQVRTVFNWFFAEFHREIDAATNADEKLTAIAKLHQRLEWLHPVRDGTARTSTVLLNKNLTDYGFHPVFLEYPHVSSSYDLNSWKNYLKIGLQKWEVEQKKISSVIS